MTLPAPPDPAALLAGARRELARLPAILGAMLADLDDALWGARPAPKEWSPVEIVCHLRDEEVEDFGARVRAIVEGAERFARIDPEGWAASLAYLAGVEPGRLARVIEHRHLGPMSGLDLLAAWVTHDRLHLAQLAATLARAGADRWAPLRAEYAGPIPYAAGDA